MSEQTRYGGEELDLATIARDDELLDALGRGEPGPAGDDLAAMLAAWRDEVADGDALRPDADDDHGLRPIAGGGHTFRPAVEAASARRARSAVLGRGVLRLAAAVIAVVVVLSTGLGVGSRHAGPSSPLWSLTRVLYPEQADVRLVEHTIQRARTAATAGRVDEARALVEEARTELTAIDDPAAVRRLSAELDSLQHALLDPVATPGAPSTDPVPPAPTGDGGPTPASPAPPQPGRSGPDPSPAPGLAVPLPELPGLPSLRPEPVPPTRVPVLPELPLRKGRLLS
ncbi:anti-sigma-D factor RsdA [Micromonospora sp. NPDC047465]|uniref:anti-sigma-D factor RsdA n=1 Tax=Micromonospora sp. NPDC047465 TaxID=3154813 RepID=UPI0033C88360